LVKLTTGEEDANNNIDHCSQSKKSLPDKKEIIITIAKKVEKIFFRKKIVIQSDGQSGVSWPTVIYQKARSFHIVTVFKQSSF